MTLSRLVIWWLCLAVCTVPSQTALSQPCGGMLDLGTLGGTSAFAQGVSADGSVVVGWAHNAANQQRAFRWTASSGMQDLGTLGGLDAIAWGVSADGSVVVGYASTATDYRAFRWTAAGGMEDLGTLGGTASYADRVSADGVVVDGFALDAAGNERAFRWAVSDGMQNLGTLGGGQSYAHGVSADGGVVVGASHNAAGQFRALRWTAAGGMQGLGTLGGNRSFAYDVSADGSVVVGQSRNASGRERAYRWTASSGMQSLGTLGGFESIARGVSADGTVVVGWALNAVGQNRAFRWTALGGMQDLGSLGGETSLAYGVSSEGTVVVGGAVNAAGNWRAFRWGGDTDGDGLLDDWECNGIPYTKADGTQGRYILDSNGDGVSDANWLRKDIFVEVDAMPGVPFSLSALADVRAAFASAPVPAPAGVAGGLPGIVLHTVVDEQNVPFQASIDCSQMPAYRQQWFGKLTERTGPDSAAMLAAKAKAYRYCLFANRMTYPGNRYLLGKASGIPGATFSVTLGGLPWTAAEIERSLGSTFMHELGHTLGLCHGGHDHIHYKPNYISVMNYNFDELYRQSGSNWVRLPLDFSRESLGTLDEACLDEHVGVSGSSLHAGVSVPFAHAGPSGTRVAKRLIIGTIPLDWNGDGATGSCVVEDVTWFPSGHPLNDDPTPGDPLTGSADWPFLKYAVPVESPTSFSCDPVQLSCAGTARVCDLTEELVIWQRLNLPPPAAPCPADIAAADGTPGPDGAVNNGDFQCFFSNFFNATCPLCGTITTTPCNPADIGQSDAAPGPDGCVDNGDFSLFFSSFFAGC